MFGGLFLTNPSDISTTPNTSSKPSSSNHHYSNPQNTQFFSEHQQVLQRVTHNLDEVLHVMNQLNEGRKNSDCKDMSYKGAAAEFTWLLGYMIKLGPERVTGGNILNKYIEKEGLDLIVVPEQRCFCIPETHHQKTDLKAICIAIKIEGIQGMDIKIGIKRTKQLLRLILGTGISDLKWRNLVHCGDGKIAVIDTESFWGVRYGLHSLLENNTFEDDARKLIVEEIKNLNKSISNEMMLNKC